MEGSGRRMRVRIWATSPSDCPWGAARSWTRPLFSHHPCWSWSQRHSGFFFPLSSCLGVARCLPFTLSLTLSLSVSENHHMTVERREQVLLLNSERLQSLFCVLKDKDPHNDRKPRKHIDVVVWFWKIDDAELWHCWRPLYQGPLSVNNRFLCQLTPDLLISASMHHYEFSVDSTM